ncbi:MAG: hypothetical protein QMC80_03525 [Thermoplasmatales archaeon]|nr:hypothetical protein [Thermoplasmatales archaeon]
MFDPINFFHLAQQLIKGDEASVRTSISKAYYASFLIARDKLGLKLKIPEVHREVIKLLYRKTPISANSLHKLRRLRNISDYDTKINIKIDAGETSLKLADNIIGEIRGK